MKITAMAWCMILLMALTGCSAGPAQPPSPLEEPIPLDSFCFMARGMTMGSIYSYTAEKAENGTRLYLELNCGRDIIDVTAEEDVLGELGAIAAMYRLDTWNGFDKVNKWVSDGEGFTLRMTTADGQDIYANGSNEFPVNYYEAREAIDLFFQKYVE